MSEEPRVTLRERLRGAPAVAAGILASRGAGFLRASVSGALLGVGPHADVLVVALRAPNLLQNLLGEQTLSASMIPVYARLRAEGRDDAARRFAGAAFGLLAAAAGLVSLIGVLAARPFVALFNAGLLGDAARVAAGELAVDRFELAVRAVRWTFPMTALLVLSAWALAVLNSHRRFLLAYAAPVLWNTTILAALAWAALGGGRESVAGQTRLLLAACVGALFGGLLQFLVQLPSVIRLLGGLRVSFSLAAEGMREAVRMFGPAVAGRGVVQLSSYLDLFLASFLAAGALGALGYAQQLYLLPVSLFGLAVAAAALPELARRGPAERAAMGRELAGALRRSAFLNLPATAAYLVLGLPLVAGLYRLLPGRFGAEETWLVYLVLGAYSLGLPASTTSRVLQNAFYALRDARTPARTAGLRVAMSLVVGVPAMLALDRVGLEELPGLARLAPGGRLGAVGLALGAAAGAWLERALLRRSLRRSLPELDWPSRAFRTIAAVAAAATLAGVGVWAAATRFSLHPTIVAMLVSGAFAAAYFAIAVASKLPETKSPNRSTAGDAP